MPKMDPSWARSGPEKEQPREQIPWKFPIREASWPFFLTIGFESTFRPPKDPKMAPRGPLWGGLGGGQSTPKRPKTGSWAKIAFQNRHKQFQIEIFTRKNPNLGPKLGPPKGPKLAPRTSRNVDLCFTPNRNGFKTQNKAILSTKLNQHKLKNDNKL